jgi:hypothetical protein
MYKVSVQKPTGEVFIYDKALPSREEAELAMSEAAIQFGIKHSFYIEIEGAEYVDNIQES